MVLNDSQVGLFEGLRVSEFILSHEPAIRLGVFLLFLVTMASWEAVAPRRQREISRRIRWISNFGIVVLDTILLRLIFPFAAVGLALFLEEREAGLFNFIDVPIWLAVTVSLLALDLAIYIQHVIFHAVPVLWRFHRMHHADLEFDVSTGLRFHPVEIILSMAIKFVVVAALGPPVVAVLIFELTLNATAMFNHSNVRIPAPIDSLLRLVVVTPDMHRVHHSVLLKETNSNFGFNLPWWDRLFGTYISQPKEGHDEMTIGIEQFRTRRDLWLDRMLTQPFVGPQSR